MSDRGEMRFTHDSLLTGWARLKDQIAEEQRLLGARERLEQYCGRWVESAAEPRSARNRLLLEGFPLAEGRELLAKWGAKGLSDRQPELPAYIKKSDAREKRARRTMQIFGLSIAAVFALLSVGLFYEWQTTQRAKTETEASLWIARSQAYLYAGNVAPAIASARQAFNLLPSEASRSILLSALMEISPHLASVIQLGADNGVALAWTAADSLTVATASSRLQTHKVPKRQGDQDSGYWRLPLITRAQDGNQAFVHTLWPVGARGLLAIFDEGTIAFFEGEGAAPRLQTANSHLSMNSTAHSVAVGLSGSVIAVATVEEKIVLYRCDWRISALAKPACQAGPLAAVQGRAVAVSPDEARLAVGDQAGTVTIYDISGKPLGSPVSIGAPIVALSWAGSQDWLGVGTYDGQMIVLDLPSSKEIAREAFGERPIAAVTWNLKEPQVAFVCSVSSVCLWRFSAHDGAQYSAEPVIRFERGSLPVSRLSWAATGTQLASSAADNTIQVWSLEPNQLAGFPLYSRETAEITTLAVSVDGASVAAGTVDGTAIYLWDAKTGASGRAIRPAVNSEVHALAWSRKGTLASLHENEMITVIRADPQEAPTVIDLKDLSFTRFVWSDDDRTLATPFRDGRIALVDTRSPDGQRDYLDIENAKRQPFGMPRARTATCCW
jgi:hypothetical protein